MALRPLLGVFLELAALGATLQAAFLISGPYPLPVLILLIAQALTTVLIHSPSHYLVGRALGIRFSRIRLASSTAVGALPAPLKRIGSLMVVPSLSVEPTSRKNASPNRMRAMYLAGISASAGSALVVAVVTTFTGGHVAALLTWLFALGYLASDIRFSPKSGDLMRARAAMIPRA